MIVVALSAVKEVLFRISHRADRVNRHIPVFASLCRCSIMVICVFLCVQESNWQEESALNVSKAKKKSLLPKTLPGRLCSSESFREGISMIFMPACASGLRQDVKTLPSESKSTL